MKRKWSTIMAVLLALVTLMTATAPVLAQSEEELTAESRPVVRDGLAIIAPLGAPVGRPVTMTVLRRSDAGPAEGAGVWALTREEADALNERLSEMRESGEMASAEVDLESVVEVHGRFLGRTDNRGKLEHAFNEAGRYVLIAVKRGYVPGRTGIVIIDLPEALGIRAPDRAPTGEPVVITVFQKGTGEPIEGAGIWALTREQAEALREETEAMRESAETALAEIDWESLMSVRGIFMGRTGEEGNLEYAFEESGGYLLLAVKRGYLPGRKGIAIGDLPQFLAMEVKRWAMVGEDVTMTVFERASGEPVEGAGVWVLTREDAEALREELMAMRESGTTLPVDEDWESMVSVRGRFLGRTDKKGKLEHVFSEPGGYALVSVKRGYIPGHAFIMVRMPRPVVNPERAQFQRQAPLNPKVPFSNGVPRDERPEPPSEDSGINETE